MKVVILNASASLAHDEFIRIAAALQIQADRDFGPAWGKSVDIAIAGDPAAVVEPGAGLLVFLDDPKQADALGYHDVTKSGAPLGKVFVNLDLADGCKPSVTGSHELLEMIADPFINSCVLSPDATKLYALEVCDACEADGDGYDIDVSEGKGASSLVTVSDFVLPPWFGSPGTQFDFMGRIGSPFELRAGGYIGMIDLGNLGAGWQTVTADAGGSHRNGGAAYAPKSRARLRGLGSAFRRP